MKDSLRQGEKVFRVHGGSISSLDTSVKVIVEYFGQATGLPYWGIRAIL